MVSFGPELPWVRGGQNLLGDELDDWLAWQTNWWEFENLDVVADAYVFQKVQIYVWVDSVWSASRLVLVKRQVVARLQRLLLQ